MGQAVTIQTGFIGGADRRAGSSAKSAAPIVTAEAIILGGTDLFLAFDGAVCGFATIDCARVHVEAILARAGLGRP